MDKIIINNIYRATKYLCDKGNPILSSILFLPPSPCGRGAGGEVGCVSLHTIFTLIPLLLFSLCTAPTKQKQPPAYTPFNSARTHQPKSINLQGHCTLHLAKSTMTAQFMLESDSGTINSALIDELGVPLAIITANDSVLTLTKHFPPVTKQRALLFGHLANALAKSFWIDKTNNGILQKEELQGVTLQYYLSQNNLDSLAIHTRLKSYKQLVNSNSTTLLNNKLDTLCSCLWE